MDLNTLVDEALLTDMIDRGYVTVREHNEYPLRIFNYSKTWVRFRHAEFLSAKDQITERVFERLTQMLKDPSLHLLDGTIDRKKFAAQAKKWQEHSPHYLFLALDGKTDSVDEMAWDEIYPPHETPFKDEE